MERKGLMSERDELDESTAAIQSLRAGMQLCHGEEQVEQFQEHIGLSESLLSDFLAGQMPPAAAASDASTGSEVVPDQRFIGDGELWWWRGPDVLLCFRSDMAAQWPVKKVLIRTHKACKLDGPSRGCTCSQLD